jgi:succinate dehydrogenase / fumarate reductase flavoprotein subunit
LLPFEHGKTSNEQPFAILSDLQEFMQDLVGIVRVEEEMQQALTRLNALRVRMETIGCTGTRAYNPGWQTAIDLRHQLIVSEAITRAGIERKESRGAHFRDDYPEKVPEFGSMNITIQKSASGSMTVTHEPLTPMPPELDQIIKEMK